MHNLALAAGAALLGASALSVAIATQQDRWHMLLTAAVAVGVLIGSAVVGRAWRANRRPLALMIALSLIAGEAFNVLASSDRVVAERERIQSVVTRAAGAHAHAGREMVKAQAAYDAATRAQIADASKPGCKDRCVAMLADAVKLAKLDLDRARHLVEANPEPSVSGTPLADRLGIPAWTIDLALAALFSIAANGLAVALIAYGAHGTVRHVETPVVRTSNGLPNRSEPFARRSTGRTMIEAEHDLVTMLAMNRSIPSQQVLAERWCVAKSTVSVWLKAWDARGLTQRRQDGKRKAVTAA